MFIYESNCKCQNYAPAKTKSIPPKNVSLFLLVLQCPTKQITPPTRRTKRLVSGNTVEVFIDTEKESDNLNEHPENILKRSGKFKFIKI